MEIIKKISFLSFFLVGMSLGNTTQAQVHSQETIEITSPPIEFSNEDIEKIRTLIERQLKTRVSQAEFSMFGKPTKENLALFKKIDETQKEDPFFSQLHITYIIQSMETRLGMKRPESTITTEKTQKKRKVEKVSKLPKDKSDQS